MLYFSAKDAAFEKTKRDRTKKNDFNIYVVGRSQEYLTYPSYHRHNNNADIHYNADSQGSSIIQRNEREIGDIQHWGEVSISFPHHAGYPVSGV